MRSTRDVLLPQGFQNVHLQHCNLSNNVAVYGITCLSIQFYVTCFVADVCLPAVFMPTRTSHVYSPKAHSYFHPPGNIQSALLRQHLFLLFLCYLSVCC